ncbi:MAG TPA: hypothetical protein VM913_00070 [Sphingomicrobium sp.]|nr:hypothetical protein [Sphingomicrobium sp.]
MKLYPRQAPVQIGMSVAVPGSQARAAAMGGNKALAAAVLVQRVRAGPLTLGVAQVQAPSGPSRVWQDAPGSSALRDPM